MSAPLKPGRPLLLLKDIMKSAFWPYRKTSSQVKYSSGIKKWLGAVPTAGISMKVQKRRSYAPPASGHPVTLSF